MAGCGGGGSSEPAGEVTAEVTLTEDEAFDPLRVQVAEGEAVRWNNETGERRTVRANTEADDSNEWELDLAIEAGESGTHTFQSSGVYSYHDAQDTHFLMCGAVAVGDTSENDIGSLPCE
jgi:plastocyanin